MTVLENGVENLIDAFNTRMTERWRFETDGDGHWYLILDEHSSDFHRLLNEGHESGDYCDFANAFDAMRIDSVTNWTFERPE